MRKSIVVKTGPVVAALLALASLPNASASLVFDALIPVSGAGFGNIPRDLTVQATGNRTAESGCVGLSGGNLTFGTCISNASVFDSNGVANVGGDEPNPQADNQKYGAPTLASLGITNASQIQIIFDATEPGGNAITITDLTLKFYGLNDVFIGAIDGQQAFASTVPGNGQAGFAFVVSADEQAMVNTFLASTSRLALEASFTGSAGGPESFFIRNGQGGPSPIPEPGTYALMGSALAAVALLRKKLA